MAKGKVGYIVRTNNTIERKEFSAKGMLGELYVAIGGGCDCVAAASAWIPGRQLVMYCDDDGYANGQEPNLIATLVSRQDAIVGNVVIMGDSAGPYLYGFQHDISSTRKIGGI